MKVLLVGSGGREHALAWRLRAGGHEVIAVPGNPGMAEVAERVDLAPDDFDALAALGHARRVDLVVIGPEAPLVSGAADRLRARGLAVFGPSAAAARLEGSKVFAKQFFRRHGIRTAEFEECGDAADVDRALAHLGGRVVVKADGLAAGKGVVVCDGADQAREAALSMLEGGRFGAAGRRVIIEQRLAGRELSVLALCDGHRCEMLPPVEDHKAALDGDRGPNTGGMGTVSPAPWATPALLDRVRAEIFEPTLAGLRAEALDYRGVLYAGLMVDDEGAPWILEYNCRFGDPETQPLMARLEIDLGAWLLGAARGALPAGPIDPSPRAAVCVILAAHGYPGKVRTGDRITGLDRLPDGVMAFHAGTARVGGELVTAGGRVLGVTAVGDDVAAARRLAYQAVAGVTFDGMHFRRDIGARRREEAEERDG
ncbi:MAG TPA: phosphoribosylamine--glycine ligase [Kofleriaceae bacterium]|nr:phosphoribosylamine--glycine ligase [Kofleriaceae bacterium]